MALPWRAMSELPSNSPGEPLGLTYHPIDPPSALSDLRSFELWFSSRGDRVPGRLLLPTEGDGPFPVVLLQHGTGDAKDAEYIDTAGGPWARDGLAVASIDFPLHGERADAKLSALLLGELAGTGAGLTKEFARQALHDLAQAVSAVSELPQIDGDRLGYAGFGLGARIGAAFCARDPRPRAAALVLGGGGVGPPELDPMRHVAKIAPRPVLLVHSHGDGTVPRAAAQALFDAAAQPKQQLWFEGTHTQLPAAAHEAIRSFLRDHVASDAGR